MDPGTVLAVGGVATGVALVVLGFVFLRWMFRRAISFAKGALALGFVVALSLALLVAAALVFSGLG